MDQTTDIKEFLLQKVSQYNQVSFISTDPISIPHSFTGKEDIEISGFLTALISWGQRKSIVKSGKKLMNLMGNKPHQFVLNAGRKELEDISDFVYRTFNGDDLLFLIAALKEIYLHKGGLEQIATTGFEKTGDIKGAIIEIRNTLLQTPHLKRSEKHLADPQKGSAAKRINMFLRWMVRKDNNGVDFGIWEKIPQSRLMCPLDVHSGNTARALGLLKRKQNDWKAVEELTECLKKMDPEDPVKFDFALFGTGVFEKNSTIIAGSFRTPFS